LIFDSLVVAGLPNLPKSHSRDLYFRAVALALGAQLHLHSRSAVSFAAVFMNARDVDPQLLLLQGPERWREFSLLQS
jgi:hypothetical protein